MRFLYGQELIYIGVGRWTKRGSGKTGSGPVKNEIVTFSHYHKNGTHIYLKEWGDKAYQDTNFRPVADISELTEILNHEHATV